MSKIVAETVHVIWEELNEEHMPAPTKESLKTISEDFYSIWNFPNCLGSIDGKHIRVQCPQKTGSMYYNYKSYFSIVLQAVADAHYKFTTVDVGGYGKQSDGGTFKASELYKVLKEKIIEIPEPTFLPNTRVKAPYVFVGDEAYPLLPFLLRPYSRNQLTFEDTVFNERLSRCRKTVECAFGILRSKWRLLSKGIETSVEFADAIVKCMCVLHNTIIDREGVQHSLTETIVCATQNRVNAPGRPSNEAKNVRDTFKSFFLAHPLVYTGQAPIARRIM